MGVLCLSYSLSHEQMSTGDLLSFNEALSTNRAPARKNAFSETTYIREAYYTTLFMKFVNGMIEEDLTCSSKEKNHLKIMVSNSPF